MKIRLITAAAIIAAGITILVVSGTIAYPIIIALISGISVCVQIPLESLEKCFRMFCFTCLLIFVYCNILIGNRVIHFIDRNMVIGAYSCHFPL